MSCFVLPFSEINNEELSSLLEDSSRDFANDYVHTYFDQIGSFNRYLDDPLAREGFNMLQSNYYDLTDMPRRPICEPDELPMYVISFNIRSVPRNLEVFIADFQHLPVDVFGLCETRLTANLEPLYHWNRFDSFSCSRNTQGGGVQLYVRQIYRSEKVCKLAFMYDCLECVFVRCKHNGKDYLIGQFYR